ncbi:MAG: DAK2 domain-containing protein [Dehalococcoidia bacterium]|nr:MAG: DAK2 domain-containing protein [Dehalococcoidia bacterium]
MIATLVKEKGRIVSCSGLELREMFCLATRLLEKNATAINALNVFPVPDGDTGTNMLLTMRSTMTEAARQSDKNASNIAQAMSRGALMGARGNSGVILSQIIKGFADGLEDQENLSINELTNALDQAAQAAYKAISKPREGTMLTVIRDVASEAKGNVNNPNQDLIGLMQLIVAEAEDSVERTPELLDILKQAGVVDAGGQGIYIILKGMLSYLLGETDEIETIESEVTDVVQPAFMAAKNQSVEKDAYGFCTEFIIKGSDLNQNQIRQWAENHGESVLVVGDEETTKVHMHTNHPGEAVEFAIFQGSIHDIKIQNMDDQHEEFVQIRRTPMPLGNVAVIAVAAGPGLEKVFYSLGASVVIPGGQTMNPSCSDILKAIDSVPSSNVIVLPNNKNITPAAKQAAGLTKKKVKVLASCNIPQGISALIAYNSEAGLDSNMDEMAKTLDRVRSIEITRAVRDTKIGKIKTQQGDYIGLLDGHLKVASNNLRQAACDILKTAGVENAEVVSLYYGNDIKDKEAMRLSQSIRRKYPHLEIELIAGGQPHYYYIMSIE